MKKFFVSIIAMVMTVGAMAQGQMQFKPEDMAARQSTQIKEVCKLTDEQYKAVYEIILNGSKQMMAELDSVRAAGGDMRQAFDREKMRKRNEAQNAAVKALLNQEQQEAYDKMQAERRNRMGGRPRQQ